MGDVATVMLRIRLDAAVRSGLMPSQGSARWKASQGSASLTKLEELAQFSISCADSM